MFERGDEEIELKEDEIIGINNKIPNLRQELQLLCTKTNTAYQQLIFCKKPLLYPAYNELAQKLSESVKEYWVLQGMCKNPYQSGYYPYYSDESLGALGLIPSLPENDKYIFKRSNYDSTGIGDKLRQRFGIPDYNYRNHEIYRQR